TTNSGNKLLEISNSSNCNRELRSISNRDLLDSFNDYNQLIQLDMFDTTGIIVDMDNTDIDNILQKLFNISQKKRSALYYNSEGINTLSNSIGKERKEPIPTINIYNWSDNSNSSLFNCDKDASTIKNKNSLSLNKKNDNTTVGIDIQFNLVQKLCMINYCIEHLQKSKKNTSLSTSFNSSKNNCPKATLLKDDNIDPLASLVFVRPKNSIVLLTLIK
ncbi:27378_t:CDS:2, partial [Racocetra persica]